MEKTVLENFKEYHLKSGVTSSRLANLYRKQINQTNMQPPIAKTKILILKIGLNVANFKY